MWRWKTEYTQSRLYFSTALEACADLTKNVWSVAQQAKARLIYVPDNGNFPVNIGVEFRGLKVVPSIPLSYDTPFTESLAQAYFRILNEVKPEQFKQDNLKRYTIGSTGVKKGSL